jgi:hypothetical protein
MKKLYLHIGLGKTGSSALQSWLSLNAEAMTRQGIDYADTVPEVKYGESLSGNGSLLHKACISQDFEEVESLLTSTYFFTPENNVAIISCELFQGIRPSTILQLREICEKNGIEIHVIAYARSVYEVLYSTYIQFVKRSSYTHSFGEHESDISFSTTAEYLRRYLEVFGDNMVVLNYDEAKKDIYSSFSEATGITKKGLKKLKLKVNRSLSFHETEILRRMNALHKGAFATQISNYVIGVAPALKTPVFYDELLVQLVRKNSEEELQWVNEQFQLAPALVSDHYAGQESAKADPPNRASYQPILRWALEFLPVEEYQTDFASFLKEFATFMVEFSSEDSLALIKRAYEVQQAVAELSEQPVEDEMECEAAPSRPRYLMAYFHDVEAPEIEDESSSFASNFYAWVDRIEPHVVGSTINALENAHLLKPADAKPMGEKPPMSGFSIVEAEDMDLVLTLAGKCPILDIGGVVEVSHIVGLHQAPVGSASRLAIEEEG